MKKIIVFMLILSGLQACTKGTFFGSTTYIPPAKTFALGEGKHNAYGATVKNVGKTIVEVIQVDEQGVNTSLGTLAIDKQNSFEVKANHAILFKNQSTKEQGTLAIQLFRVTSSLSMGYLEGK